MVDSVIICIGTVGSPTFDRCKQKVKLIERNSPLVIETVVIKDYVPQSAWLNQMRVEAKKAKWCLQVDEDMYLKEEALSELLSFGRQVEDKGKRILNVSSLLYDLFLRQNVGSLKLWNSEALQNIEFRDVMGGDRDFAKRAKKLGFSNFSTDLVLGEHDSAPDAGIAFSKYYEYTQKIRKFKGEASARAFSDSLKKKWEKDGCYISKKAYDGSKHGLANKVKDKSKRSV